MNILLRSGIKVIFLPAVLFFSVFSGTSAKAQSFAKPLEPIPGAEWKTLVNTPDMSFSYEEVKLNNVIGYSLKMVNNTSTRKTVVFGVAGLQDVYSKSLYPKNSFQARKIPLEPGQTLVGSEALPALLIFTADHTVPLANILQNLSIQ